jgi:hypothetical protein
VARDEQSHVLANENVLSVAAESIDVVIHLSSWPEIVLPSVLVACERDMFNSKVVQVVGSLRVGVQLQR